MKRDRYVLLKDKRAAGNKRRHTVIYSRPVLHALSLSLPLSLSLSFTLSSSSSSFSSSSFSSSTVTSNVRHLTSPHSLATAALILSPPPPPHYYANFHHCYSIQISLMRYSVFIQCSLLSFITCSFPMSLQLSFQSHSQSSPRVLIVFKQFQFAPQLIFTSPIRNLNAFII